MNPSKIAKYLNELLNIKEIKDASRNGLQVKVNKKVTKVGFAVDACISTFEKAKKAGCDMLIVHHGLLWKGYDFNKELLKKRISYLRKNNLSLYASHLPLDLHNEFGNNIQIAKKLNLKRIKPFGKYHGFSIGYVGYTNSNLSKIKKQIPGSLWNFGKKTVKSIAIVSGGGSSTFDESLKYDLLITGEAPHHIYNEAKDQKHNVLLGGHYDTEVYGIKALMPLIKEKFNIKTVFIDNPTNT